MNDQGREEGPPYHHQQQHQQHGYPPMHQQQPLLSHISNQHHIFPPPPPPQPQMVLNQPVLASHHHPHPHHHQQSHPLVQTEMPPQYHQLTSPSENSQPWGGGGTSMDRSHDQTQQQPPTSGHYSQESDQIFKGATEHLFSAVQQQLESLRDQESEESQRSRAQENPPIDSSVTSTPKPISEDSKDNATNKDKGDGLLTVKVRIIEANRESKAQNDQTRAIETPATDNQSSCISVGSQQTSVSSASEHPRQDQANPERQSGIGHSDIAATGAQDSPDSNETNQLKDTTNIPSLSSTNTTSAPNTSTSATPVKPFHGSNREEAENQQEKDLTPQINSQTMNEKGEVWQTLTIGGKSVRYKVLGNVKMRKATVISNKAPSDAAQIIRDKDGNPKIVTPSKSGTAVLKPGNPHVRNCTLVTATDMLGSAKQGDPKVPATVIGGKVLGVDKKPLKIVKILPPGTDLTKIERRPVISLNSSSSSPKEVKQQVQSSPTTVGRPRKYKRPMKYEGSGQPVISLTDAGSSSPMEVTEKSPSELGRPRKNGKRPMKFDGVRKTSQTTQDESSKTLDDSNANESQEEAPSDERASNVKDQSSSIDNGGNECSMNDVESDDSDAVGSLVIGKVQKRRLLDDLPGKRRSSRKRKPVIQDEDDEEDATTETVEESKKDKSQPPNKEPVDTTVDKPSTSEKKKSVRRLRDTRMTRWSHREIVALSGFLLSAKKAGVYDKEWPKLRNNDSFWNRAADCCNVVRFDKKKRTGKACAHWTYCYLKPRFISTSQMSFHYNSDKAQTANIPPDQYTTCKCYKPPHWTTPDDYYKPYKPPKGRPKYNKPKLSRDRCCQASTIPCTKETQTVVSTVSGISSGLKDFVSKLTSKDALEVADIALHYALKEQTIYNVADNFLELCVAAFKVLQKYRQGNVIEEFARVLATTRDDQLPRMQPDKMPFAMIAYNIRYFNNASPFGLTVPTPYQEWLQGMYNLYGARFLELFEGPIPRKTDISDRHPYRRVLLNVATVSKNYFKRVIDEKDKAEAMASQIPLENQSENPQHTEGTPEGQASQEAMKRRNLMNKQGKSIRELMTDAAIPVLARRKLQQAFAIMQHYTYLNAPDNEPTCELCGASIPKPPKPPKKTFRKKGDRKRMQGDRLKGEGKRRRLDASKSANKNSPVPVNLHVGGVHRKGNTEHSSSQEMIDMSIPNRKTSEPQRRPDSRSDPYPRNLAYHPSSGASPLERMIINAPGMAPPRELPPSLHEDWGSGRAQQISITPVATVVRDVYPNHGTVDIMWQPGQPTSGWQHGEVRNQVPSPQQPHSSQHGQRTSMVPASTSSTPPAGVQHIGQPQVSHTYY